MEQLEKDVYPFYKKKKTDKYNDHSKCLSSEINPSTQLNALNIKGKLF